MLKELDEVIKRRELDVVAFNAFGALTELDLGGSEDDVSLRELDEDLSLCGLILDRGRISSR